MLNQVNLIGNLGKDPDLRYTQAGTAVCSFSLATTEKHKDKEHTEWHNVVAWGKLAEICGQYLTKGKTVYIGGRIQSRSYDDKDGNKRYVTEIVADTMKMVGRKQPEANNNQPVSDPQRGVVQETVAQPDDDVPF